MLNEYEETRMKRKELNKKLISIAEKDDLRSAGDILGIRDGDSFYCDSEKELNVFQDTLIHEPVNGQPLFEKAIIRDDFSVDEKNILESYRSSILSAFQPMENHPEEGIILGTDVFTYTSISLIDKGFSKTLKGSFILFSRLIPFGKVFMTSGMALVFEGTPEIFLNRFKKYSRKVKDEKASIKTIKTVFEMDKHFGYNIRFE